MTVLSPMVTPASTMAPPPSHTLSPIVMGFAASTSPFEARLDRMSRSQELHVRSDLDVVPDGDRATSSATRPKFAKQRAPIVMWEP